MNNDEKIRLVLETLGVDSVRQASKAMRELAENVDKTGEAATTATGRGSGQGILQLAFAIDDLQYGIRGIVNNIPVLAQSLGLGAGLAGVAGIAAVAVNQLVAAHPEWFEWSEKVKTKLGELTDAIKAEEGAIKRQKEAVDKLAESNSTRIEDIQKLKSMTEDLKAAEDQLDKDRKNRKAAEDAAKNQGVAADEELAFQKDIAKQIFTDTGTEKDLYDKIASEISKKTPEIDTKSVRESFLKEFGGTMSGQEVNRLANQRIGTLANKRNEEIRASADSIFGGIMKPGDQAEFDDAMGRLGEFAPEFAAQIRGDVQWNKDDTAFNQGIEARQRAIARRNERLGKGDASTAKLMKAKMSGDKEAVIMGRASAGPAGGVPVGFGADGGGMPTDGFGNMGIPPGMTLEEWQAAQATEAAARNATLAQFDPAQLAAMRLLQSGGSVRGTRQLERRDRAVFGNALMQRGMAPGAAAEATDQSIEGGERQLMEFAESINAPMKSAADFMRVATIYLQKVGMNAMQIQEQMNAMQMQMNMLANSQQAPMQPQHLRANK